MVNIKVKTVRNLISLLLASLLFLNVLGYYGVFLGLHYKNDLSMAEKLDAENYKDSETITIKVPVTVPYATDSRDFERIEGEFEYNGEFYRMVKQKLLQDTLFIVCVKDYENKKINQALSSFVKTFSDTPANHQSSNTKTALSFIKDYFAHSFSLRNQSLGWESDVAKESRSNILIPAFQCTIIHPPERA